jgi:serine/threonine-protein kinase RsbW
MQTETFPGSYACLARIDDFVMKAAVVTGFDEAALYGVQTAVDEACANIIDHAYGGENKGEIVCTVEADATRVKIVLEDRGLPFDPDAVASPDVGHPLSRRKEGGLGLFFIRSYMDVVHFDFSADHGNRLTLIKYKGNPPE